MANEEPPSFLGILGRMFWMMLGPILLLMLAYTIIKTGNGWLTAADFGYLGVLGMVMLARWLEFRSGNPQTAEGKPATPEHLRRYALGVTLVGLSVWVIANVIGNQLLVLPLAK